MHYKTVCGFDQVFMTAATSNTWKTAPGTNTNNQWRHLRANLIVLIILITIDAAHLKPIHVNVRQHVLAINECINVCR